MFSVISLCVVLGAVGADDPWIKVLRDAQLANQSAIRQGTASLEIEFLPGKAEKGPVEIRAEVQWRDDAYLAKVKVSDPYNIVLGRAGVDRPLDQRPWELMANDGKKSYVYAAHRNVLEVRDLANQTCPPLLQVHPRVLSTTCCPPTIGRPWTEMVGLLPASPSKPPSTLEFEEVEPGRIKQTRRDPDGGVLEIVFSLDDCGYPVSFRYTNAEKSRSPLRQLTLRWRKIGDACILADYESISKLGGKAEDEAEPID